MTWLGRVNWLVATFGGLGMLQPAPGTIGSLGGLALWWWMFQGKSLSVQLIGVLTMAAIAIVVADRVVGAMGGGDPCEIVIDEVAGMWLAMVAVEGWRSSAASFLLFRLFDIMKPPPARQAEYLRGGWGIVGDDMVAGLYALAAVHILMAATGW